MFRKLRPDRVNTQLLYQEVVTLTEEIDQKDLYQIAAKDFSQARQILESIQQVITHASYSGNIFKRVR